MVSNTRQKATTLSTGHKMLFKYDPDTVHMLRPHLSLDSSSQNFMNSSNSNGSYLKHQDSFSSEQNFPNCDTSSYT